MMLNPDNCVSHPHGFDYTVLYRGNALLGGTPGKGLVFGGIVGNKTGFNREALSLL